MRAFFDTLNEKDRRRYAGIEAFKLGHGGQKYICSVLGCHFQTVMAGIHEITNGTDVPEERIRKAGGGRKKIIETKENIDDVFFEILNHHTAGSPIDAEIKWTNLSLKEISKKTSSIFSSVSIIFFLPPPGFRILSSGISEPLVISLIPAMTVWKWHPSTLLIYFCPPCPNLIASMAAYRLLSFSFKVSKNALIFCSISSGYFMRSNYSIPLLFSK